MGVRTTLFSDPQINNRIAVTANLLREASDSDTDLGKSRIRLATVLEMICNNADDFDEKCQFNIANVRNGFSSAVVDHGGRVNAIDLPKLNVLVFRFVTEYDLSSVSELELEYRQFINGVIDDSQNYSADVRGQIDFALQRMPIAIMKSLLNSSEFTTLRDVQSIAQATNDKVAIWTKEIANSEKRVHDLQDVLKSQRDNFNFVGLSKGFKDLEDTVNEELDTLQGRMFVFGTLVLIPIVLEFISLNFGWVDVAKANPISLIASAVASVTATFILLYFFRITLHSADACRAQLVQIRLRMTLCRFIQSYAEYSAEIKGKNADALSKFENLIFSGIVSTDDKLPSTFDGIEQLGGLLKAVRGEGK